MNLPVPLIEGHPLTALAPMQDVTTLAFMTLMGEYGPPDYFFTEYFRVHESSRLEPKILASITENPTGRPVFAQLIGESLPDIHRTVEELSRYPVAGIDLNMGCPAPKVYKKCVGGGLLRDLDKVNALFELLREVAPKRFTVKMRIGFEDTSPLQPILELIHRHKPDLVSIHGRTVKDRYHGTVNYHAIGQAVEYLNEPVLANGNISSPAKASAVLKQTRAAGVMIGRAAIRNPWIFRQIREWNSGQPIYQPKLEDVRIYIERLYAKVKRTDCPERVNVSGMKKFLNFIGLSIDADGQFLYQARRARSEKELFTICDHFLIEDGKAFLNFPAEPYSGLVARPNCEIAR